MHDRDSSPAPGFIGHVSQAVRPLGAKHPSDETDASQDVLIFVDKELVGEDMAIWDLGFVPDCVVRAGTDSYIFSTDDHQFQPCRTSLSMSRSKFSEPSCSILFRVFLLQVRNGKILLGSISINVLLDGMERCDGIQYGYNKLECAVKVAK